MAWTDNYEYTYLIGIGGFVLTVIGWISLRRGPGLTYKQMVKNARICYIVGFLKVLVGIFLLMKMNGGNVWGFILIIFGVLWIIRGNRWKRFAYSRQARIQAIGARGGNNANNNGARVPNNNQYQRIAEVDGPEGPQNQQIPQVIIHQQPPIQGNNGYPGQQQQQPGQDQNSISQAAAAAAPAANSSNVFVPTSQYGVVMPQTVAPPNAVPPAAFPGPAYLIGDQYHQQRISTIQQSNIVTSNITKNANGDYNDDLTTPLNSQNDVDETAPVPYQMEMNVPGVNGNGNENDDNNITPEGPVTYN